MPDRYGDRDYDDDYPPPGLRVASTEDDYDPSPEEIADFLATERDSLSIQCRFCRAPIGQPCFNAATERTARKFIAHPIRITDHKSQVSPPTAIAHSPARGGGTPDDDEELF